MKNIFLWAVALLICTASCTSDRAVEPAQVTIDPNAVLVHYWNFNTLSGTTSSIDSDHSLVDANVSISYPGEGDGYMDEFSPGYTINARNNDTEGSGFRARNPSNTRQVKILTPTTGFKDIIVQFATSRTSSGATVQNYSYSTDGTTYTTEGLSLTTFNVGENPLGSLVTLDFRGISSVEDNPDFTIKIEFGGDSASGATGNNRFDNISIDGVPLN